MAKVNRINNEDASRGTRLMRGVFRALVHFVVWSGIAVMYYFIFSFFFDTPEEFRLRTSTHKLRHEYENLNARYDSLMAVLENVSERDRNVFQVLFESDPYDFEGIHENDGWLGYEKLMGKENRQLADELFDKLKRHESNLTNLYRTYITIQSRIEEMDGAVDRIPSIQPVVNNDLTLLTASFGLRIHPFYRSLALHGGVDYTVPEGTRVFATADGTVKDVSTRNTGSGLTVVVNHGNGYETTYSHLSRSNVKKGDSVKRGDIIARTGNTGLSLAPHLHYEIRHNGMRVDPIHYFFMELTPGDYQRMIRITQSGLQSFD